MLDAIGKLVLRVAVAGLMLFHGVHKALHGVDGLRTTLASKGLPGFFVYGVYVGEIVAPILILAGWYSRPAALVLAFNMIVAISLAHAGDVARLGKQGQWAIELQLLYFFGAIAIALIGPGRYSLSRGRSRLG